MPGVQATESAPTLLEAIKAVEALQERRVALWNEYDEAMDAFFASPPSAPPAPQGAPIEANGHSHSCAHAGPARLAPDQGTISEITRIVASGLLEAGHELRAVQTQLSLPSADQPGPPSPEHASTSESGFGRPDMARILDQIQTGENALLRVVVARDQRRRTEHLEQGHDPALLHPPPTWYAEAQLQIRSLRAEVQEAMVELAAEKAELSLSE